MNKVKEIFYNSGYEFKTDLPMSNYTSIHAGGIADCVVYPKDPEDFINILNEVSKEKLPFMVLGAGTNTIVCDKGIRGIVISTKRLKFFKINDDGTVLAESGAMLSAIMNKTVSRGLTGFEFAAGIPGTVGGAVFMNAGANEGEIKDVIEKIWIFTNGREIELERRDINFEYRKSNLPKDSIVTKALFRLKKGNRELSEKNIKNYLEHRNKTQPVNLANTGSIFKNPNNDLAAGQLLEELGMKGQKMGEAMFSELHANFIVNSKNAKGCDIIKLIKMAKDKAFTEKGINLETEVVIIGNC